MKTFIERREYLCGIGNHKEKRIEYHMVGKYDNRGFFYFNNGADNSMQLSYRKQVGSNSIVVLNAKLIKETL